MNQNNTNKLQNVMKGNEEEALQWRFGGKLNQFNIERKICSVLCVEQAF